jgi:hypothetical protein
MVAALPAHGAVRQIHRDAHASVQHGSNVIVNAV